MQREREERERERGEGVQFKQQPKTEKDRKGSKVLCKYLDLKKDASTPGTSMSGGGRLRGLWNAHTVVGNICPKQASGNRGLRECDGMGRG